MSEELYLTDIDTDDYSIISKNTNDILNDMDFKDDDDRYMCYSIINSLEKYAAQCIRDTKIVSLPFKLLIFVAVDGWSLIVKGLVESFN